MPPAWLKSAEFANSDVLISTFKNFVLLPTRSLQKYTVKVTVTGMIGKSYKFCKFREILKITALYQQSFVR